MKVSKKAKGLVDYTSAYNHPPEDMQQPELTEEEEAALLAMYDDEMRERAENAATRKQLEEQAKKNLEDILYIPGAIGKRLAYLFEKKGIEQKDFARQVGISRTTLYRYLSEKTAPTKKKLLIIIEALDMEVEDFCFEPNDFPKWVQSLEADAVRRHDIFQLRERLMGELSQNNFTYQYNGHSVRLPRKYYLILKAALESSFRVLDLLAHDKDEE